MTPCTCQKWREFRDFRFSIKMPSPDCDAAAESWTYCPYCGKSLASPAEPTPEPMTMQARQHAADAAFRRDIEKERAEFDILMVEKRLIPKGAKLVECYETDFNYYIIGLPEWYDESHNCDAMGCSSLSHVIEKVAKTDRPKTT